MAKIKWNGGLAEKLARRQHQVLNQFQQVTRHCDAATRLAKLIGLSRVVLERNTEIRKLLRRRHQQDPTAGYGTCWVCERERTLVRHHVIQLQHGGSNARLNQVHICVECHSYVHPHLRIPTSADGTLLVAANGKLAQPSTFDSRPRLVKR